MIARLKINFARQTSATSSITHSEGWKFLYLKPHIWVYMALTKYSLFCLSKLNPSSLLIHFNTTQIHYILIEILSNTLAVPKYASISKMSNNFDSWMPLRTTSVLRSHWFCRPLSVSVNCFLTLRSWFSRVFFLKGIPNFWDWRSVWRLAILLAVRVQPYFLPRNPPPALVVHRFSSQPSLSFIFPPKKLNLNQILFYFSVTLWIWMILYNCHWFNQKQTVLLRLVILILFDCNKHNCTQAAMTHLTPAKGVSCRKKSSRLSCRFSTN